MEVMIEWSELSIRQLKDIFDYYSSEANPRIARKVINRIHDRVSILETNPQADPKEPLLENHPEGYRFLVETNYKIIYWQKDNIITISSVFDCRQNPQNIIVR